MRTPRCPLWLAALPLAGALSPALAQTPLGRLSAPQPNAYDFARSVALTGTVAVVGEAEGGPKGRIHAFDAVTGEPLWMLGKNAPEYLHLFGQALAADAGRVLAVSHHFGLLLDAQTGTIQGALRQPPGSGWGFNPTADLSGSRAALSVEDQAFVYDVETGILLHTIDSPMPADENRFGTSVALDGELLAVGAPFEDSLDGDEAVFLYDATSGQQVATLVRDGGAGGAQFGRAVDVRGDRILVGAPYAAVVQYGTGAAYLFDALGNQLVRFVSPRAAPGDSFGSSVHLGARTAVIGAPGANDAAGEVHVFDLASGEWLWSVGPQDRPLAHEQFGAALDVDAGRLATGAPGDAFDGAAYLHTLGDPALGRSYCGPANLNSTGAPATLEAFGSADARASLVRLAARRLPPGRAAAFLVSRTRDFVPFVNGSQGDFCLGGAIGRFEPVGAADPAGRIDLLLDLRAIPQPAGGVVVAPGETWNFQVWYRDVNPSATSNLTDARAVTFD